MQHMLDAGVSTRRGVMNAHLEEACAHLSAGAGLPVSEHAQQHGVILPVLPGMQAEVATAVVNAIRSAVDHGLASASCG